MDQLLCNITPVWVSHNRSFLQIASTRSECQSLLYHFSARVRIENGSGLYFLFITWDMGIMSNKFNIIEVLTKQWLALPAAKGLRIKHFIIEVPRRVQNGSCIKQEYINPRFRSSILSTTHHFISSSEWKASWSIHTILPLELSLKWTGCQIAAKKLLHYGEHLDFHWPSAGWWVHSLLLFHGLWYILS